MRPIAPRLNHPHATEVSVAEDQPQYMTVTMSVVHHSDGTFSMFGRWTFTPEERARVAAGEDIYVSFPGGTPPHNLSLRPEWAGALE